MRKLLFVGLLLLGTTPLRGQQLASVEVTAHLTIPDFLSMRVSAPEVVNETTRRVTVYVTANRGWQLSVAHDCEADCDGVEYRVVNGAADATRVVGRHGNDIPVVVEYGWQPGGRRADASELRYLLTAS